MKYKSIQFILLVIFSQLLFNCGRKEGKLVNNSNELKQAISKAKPGDTILMANGTWKDTEISFHGNGKKNAPIVLKAEDKGKVLLKGQSHINIYGEYLKVKGLVFKEGYTPTGEVISFKKDDKHLASHVRVTECVIDNFTNPERNKSDYWVGLHGKENRFDHNTLIGKGNRGVTVAVRLSEKDSRNNHDRIDHNYFGHRPVFGSNGGETLRIGTSHYSMFNSSTIVEDNYFERCNGEVEIISNKSGNNIFRNNVFDRSRGTLTLRHGNNNIVKNNYFLGHGEPNTGGVRIINKNQKVSNNYFLGLTGRRFFGALVIMNGVPNSPINRYMPVKNANVKHNILINIEHVGFGTGSDNERSAIPQGSFVTDNLFYNPHKDTIFDVYDDVSGITFKKNLVSKNLKLFSKKGFKTVRVDLNKNKYGLLVPDNKILKKLNFKNLGLPIHKDSVGAKWYDISHQRNAHKFDLGKAVKVKPGSNTLFDAIKNNKKSNIFQLKGEKDYLLTKTIKINRPITIKSDGHAVVKSSRPTALQLENGGSLKLNGLHISGEDAPDYTGNSIISTSRYSMNKNYKILIENSTINDLDVNKSFNVLKTYKSTFADTLMIKNSIFKNISGSIAAFDKQQEDQGIYNAQFVILQNSIFSNIQGPALNLYRGGSDESTSGPIFTTNHCVFNNVGLGKNNKTKSSLRLYGVQDTDIKNSIFTHSAPIKIHLTVGNPVTNIQNTVFHKTPSIKSNKDSYNTNRLMFTNPIFNNKTKFVPQSNELKGKSTDHKNIGVVYQNDNLKLN